MIVLSNSNAQTLAPGQSLNFDTVILHTGCGECHRPNSGSVNLRANNGIYDVAFVGNISGATVGDVLQLAINFESAPLLETTMMHTVATANAYENVAADTSVRTCCCMTGAITVVNTGTTTLTVAPNPVLKIRRVA